MEIYFATTNKGKVMSVQRVLDKYNIKVIQHNIELAEPRSSDVLEIAKAKINEAYSKIQKPTIVIDGGFYIHSLNGFPRAYVNFALETIGIEGILKLVENKPRECEFRECLAYMDEKLENPKFFLNHIKGRLAYQPRGEMRKEFWSTLPLIFIPENSDKTLAEMNDKELDNWRTQSRDENSPEKKLYDWLISY